MLRAIGGHYIYFNFVLLLLPGFLPGLFGFNVRDSRRSGRNDSCNSCHAAIPHHPLACVNPNRYYVPIPFGAFFAA